MLEQLNNYLIYRSLSILNSSPYYFKNKENSKTIKTKFRFNLNKIINFSPPFSLHIIMCIYIYIYTHTHIHTRVCVYTHSLLLNLDFRDKAA